MPELLGNSGSAVCSESHVELRKGKGGDETLCRTANEKVGVVGSDD